MDEAIGESSSARKAGKKRDWQGCWSHASRALEVGPNSVELRDLRVECATELEDGEAVYADLRCVEREPIT